MFRYSARKPLYNRGSTERAFESPSPQTFKLLILFNLSDYYYFLFGIVYVFAGVFGGECESEQAVAQALLSHTSQPQVGLARPLSLTVGRSQLQEEGKVEG